MQIGLAQWVLPYNWALVVLGKGCQRGGEAKGREQIKRLAIGVEGDKEAGKKVKL